MTGRGDDEVGVPEAALWCDAGAMDQSLAAGDTEAALALYHGPLLDGLYVAGASVEFQDWLDRERHRLRDRAGRGGRGSLVARPSGPAALSEAAGWARRALELAPDDEAALRRYLGVLDRAGDRLTALRAYDEFARRLAADLELEPSAETRALADGMRAGSAAPAGAAPPSTIAVLPFSVRGDARLAICARGWWTCSPPRSTARARSAPWIRAPCSRRAERRVAGGGRRRSPAGSAPGAT